MQPDDLVASVGRIKTIQNDSRRFIEFERAKVISVDAAGITVTPVGKTAVLLCRPEDLRLIEQEPQQFHDFDPSADVEPGSVATVERVADEQPEGDITLAGDVAQPKPTLKELRAKKQSQAKPKPRPRRRR